MVRTVRERGGGRGEARIEAVAANALPARCIVFEADLHCLVVAEGFWFATYVYISLQETLRSVHVGLRMDCYDAKGYFSTIYQRILSSIICRVL